MKSFNPFLLPALVTVSLVNPDSLNSMDLSGSDKEMELSDVITIPNLEDYYDSKKGTLTLSLQHLKNSEIITSILSFIHEKNISTLKIWQKSSSRRGVGDFFNEKTIKFFIEKLCAFLNQKLEKLSKKKEEELLIPVIFDKNNQKTKPIPIKYRKIIKEGSTPVMTIILNKNIKIYLFPTKSFFDEKKNWRQKWLTVRKAALGIIAFLLPLIAVELPTLLNYEFGNDGECYPPSGNFTTY